MASLIATITQSCAYGAGVLTLTDADAGPGDLDYSWSVIDAGGTDYGSAFDPAVLPVDVTGLPDGAYTARVRAVDRVNGNSYVSRPFSFTSSCAGGGGGGGAGSSMTLDRLSVVQPTAGVPTGTVQFFTRNHALTPVYFDAPGVTTGPQAMQDIVDGSEEFGKAGLAPGTYSGTAYDSSTPSPRTLAITFTVNPAPAPLTGCTDEYAADYNPEATQADACTYALTWRSAWGPSGLAVRVPAVVGQTKAYITALLRLGFRTGHPLALARPQGEAIALRATVGPDGYATFRLTPFVSPQLGTPDGSGGYRLDLNSPTAFSEDLFVAYELRRTTGELLEHGYALNAAVPDAQLGALTPFAGRLPVWPGFDDYLVPYRSETPQGRFGLLDNDHAYEHDTVRLPCPANPVPVAWLAPGGGYGYWVFAGRPVLGDDVAEGTTYSEAQTGERRYAQRGAARRTVSVVSGNFAGLDLLEGLRTLSASPQVWYQPVPGGAWVPVTLASGSFPAGRLGVVKQQVSISFTEALARYAQGQ